MVVKYILHQQLNLAKNLHTFLLRENYLSKCADNVAEILSKLNVILQPGESWKVIWLVSNFYRGGFPADCTARHPTAFSSIFKTIFSSSANAHLLPTHLSLLHLSDFCQYFSRIGKSGSPDFFPFPTAITQDQVSSDCYQAFDFPNLNNWLQYLNSYKNRRCS